MAHGPAGHLLAALPAQAAAAAPSGKYTELEWSIGVQSPAAGAYEFRVYAGSTPLATYAVTPQFTVSGGGGTVYNETGLSIPIVANLLSTDKAGRKELALSLPITAVATSTPALHNREAALPSTTTATFTCTDRQHHREAASLPLLTDDWTGTDGASWDTTKWPVRSGTVDIQSNAGRLTGGSHPNAVSNVTGTDFELLVKGTGSTFSGNIPEINYRLQTQTTGTNGYGIQVNGTQVILFVLPSYTGPSGGSGNFNPSGLDVNGSFWFRIRVSGNSHKIRWWADGTSEGSTWLIDTTDTLRTSGYFALGAWGGGTTTWDDLTIAPPTGLLAGPSVSTTATVDITADYHVGAGANHYDETGRSVLVTAPVTCTDKQAHKEPGVSLPITAVVTSIANKLATKELALSLPIVANIATTTLVHRRELAVSLPITAAIDSTSQAHFREPVASTTITATVTLTDLRKYVDLALSVPVTVTITGVDREHFREVTIVYVQVPVTCTDLQQSPGHFDETARLVLATVTVTSTDRAKFRDTPVTVAVPVTVTLTDLRHYTDVSLTVSITATVAATSLIHLLEPVSVLITAVVSLIDRAHFREVLPTPVLATVTISDRIALPGENRTVNIVATVTMTERAFYKQLALSVPVQATVLTIDSLSVLAFFPLLIAATFKAFDQKSRVGVVVLNDADAIYLGNERVDAVYVGSSQAWP